VVQVVFEGRSPELCRSVVAGLLTIYVDEHARLNRPQGSHEFFAELEGKAAQSVATLKEAIQRREQFDGKRIIEEFFARHVRDSGMSKEIFVYSCAKEASSRQSVAVFIEALFATLGIAKSETE